VNIDLHAIDPDLWELGIWLDYEPTGDKPCRVRLAGWMNQAHARKIGQLMLPYAGTADRQKISDAYRKAEVLAMAGTVLIGWEGMFTGPEGAEVELKFDEQTAERVLRSIPDFATWCRFQSGRVANFKAVAEVEAGKPSGPSPLGEDESPPT
jgi:hypothetical protein